MKILIIGSGRIFYKHIESIKKNNRLFKLVGICEIDKSKIKYLKKNFNIPIYSKISKAIIDCGPDLVSILTPSGLHAKHALEVLKYKKNIIIEKPMCLKLADAKKIVKMSKKQSCKVFVVMQNKFNLPVIKLFKDIKEKKFGKIFHGSISVKWRRDQSYYNQASWRGTWRYDGGVISNQASHHLDLLRTILGDPVSVFAKGFNHMSKIQCEDTALIIIKFEGNKSAIIEATTATRPKDLEGSITILGTKGSAKIGGFALNEISFYNLTKKINFTKFKTNPKNVYGFGHISFYKHVFDAIKNNKKSQFDAQNSYKTVEIMNMIYKSIETQKEVFINNNIYSKKLGR